MQNRLALAFRGKGTRFRLRWEGGLSSTNTVSFTGAHCHWRPWMDYVTKFGLMKTCLSVDPHAVINNCEIPNILKIKSGFVIMGKFICCWPNLTLVDVILSSFDFSHLMCFPAEILVLWLQDARFPHPDHRFTHHMCVCAQSLSHVWLFETSWTVVRQAHCPWDFPGKSTAVCCHFLLLGIVPIQRSNPSLLCLPALAGGFFTHLGSSPCYMYCVTYEIWKILDSKYFRPQGFQIRYWEAILVYPVTMWLLLPTYLGTFWRSFHLYFL